MKKQSEINKKRLPMPLQRQNRAGCSDKKLLWRANLYLCEGDNDWNDLHPWTFENAWNRTLGLAQYDSFANSGQISSLSEGDGKQVINIPDYSPVRIGGNNSGRVAYDYPEGNFSAYDSPFAFVYKLLSQRENIENFYTDYATQNPEETTVTFNDTDNVNVTSLETWDRTTAPVDQWRNYRTESSGGFSPYLPGVGLYWKNDAHDYLSTGLAGSTPYEEHATFNTWHTNNPNVLSAGTDCIGFAQRSGGYGKYAWSLPEDGRAYPRTAEDANLSSTAWGTYSYMIGGISNTERDDDGFLVEVGDLNLVRPGDIMYFIYGPDSAYSGSGRHIAIVNNVNYEEDFDVTYADIELIESTYYGTIAYVINSFTLDNYDQYHWRIVRLILK